MKIGPTNIYFDKMCWSRIIEAGLNWKLRYGNPSKAELFRAASIISAYKALVLKTQKDRNKICANLKNAENEKI